MIESIRKLARLNKVRITLHARHEMDVDMVSTDDLGYRLEDENMKTCFFCRGPVVTKSVDYMARHKEKYILIKNLPAKVCEQCGEIYLDADSSRQVDKAIMQTSKAKDHLHIPVISF